MSKKRIRRLASFSQGRKKVISRVSAVVMGLAALIAVIPCLHVLSKAVSGAMRSRAAWSNSGLWACSWRRSASF